MQRAGWTCIVLGILVMVGCVIAINHAAIQHGPNSSFAQRTSYSMAKRSVHETLPRVIPVAALGAVLLAGGNYLLRKSKQQHDEAE